MSTFTLVKGLIVNSVKPKLSRNTTFPQAVERIGAAGRDPGPRSSASAFCAGKAWKAVGLWVMLFSMVPLQCFLSTPTLIYIM